MFAFNSGVSSITPHIATESFATSTSEEPAGPAGNGHAPKSGPGAATPRPGLDDLKNLLLDPRANPLDVGSRLLALKPDELRAVGFGSLTELLKKGLLAGVSKPEYSTIMRWVRAASVLDGPDDPRAAWGLSRLTEVGKIPTRGELRRFLRNRDPGRMTVRELREAVRQYGVPERAGPEHDEPHAVLERAIRTALEVKHADHRPPDVQVRRTRDRRPDFTVSVSGKATDASMARALSVASSVVDAVSTAKAAWRKGAPKRKVSVPAPMPLDEIRKLPPGQLEARWLDPDVVQVLKAGLPILHLPVERCERTNHRLVWGEGNVKVRDVFGIIDSISQGCLRVATGWPGTHEPCFTLDGDKSTGCYANHTKWANRKVNREANFDVIHNGLVNDLMKVRLPLNGSPKLGRHSAKLWRVDAESTDGALSVSLGIFQVWAESNPDRDLMTICSHQFSPPDEMLAWLSSLRNAWVGHTVAAAGLSPEELDVRFASIRRFIEWRVPSAIWIVTHEDWDNAAVLDRALELVEPELIIEAPYRFRTDEQALPLLHVNPKGACSDHRVTRYGVPCVVRCDVDPGTGETEVTLVDPDGEEVTVACHSKCAGGCELLCCHGVLEGRANA